MATLALDTATPATAVAVCRGPEAWEARHDPEPAERPGHATRLLALVREAMDAAGTSWEEIERIAVGVGPGSFTGLRIGVATARGLAQSRDLPLVGASTLHALARGPEEQDRAILAVLDARRGEAFAAAWIGERQLLAPAALAPDALGEKARALAPGALAVGDGAVRFRGCLEGAGARVPADGSPLHAVRARHHCRLAAGRAADPPAAILPDYLRLPDVDTIRRT